MYSIRESAKRTKLHREYIRALCDTNQVDCIRGENGDKRLKYQITEKGIRQLDDYYLKSVLKKLNKKGKVTTPLS